MAEKEAGGPCFSLFVPFRASLFVSFSRPVVVRHLFLLRCDCGFDTGQCSLLKCSVSAVRFERFSFY